MRHYLFDAVDEDIERPIALLIKDTAFNTQELERAYAAPLEAAGIPKKDLIAFTLDYVEGKAPVKHIKTYLGNLLPALKSLGTRTLYCADAAFFKALTGQKKADANLGNVLPCTLMGHDDMDVILGVNHRSLIYNPTNEGKLALSIETLKAKACGTYTKLGSTIINHEEYPSSFEEIKAVLKRLRDKPRLSVDIEGFSLRFNEAGIATIGFAWSEHEGCSFAVDYKTLDIPDLIRGRFEANYPVRSLLRQFFSSYTGEIIFHNAPYDTKVLIYCLWMKNLLDNEGLLTGLEILFKNLHDTKVMAYLCLNSCAGNKLSLKELAHEFAGSWAQEDITDIRRIPLDSLLQYNLVDCLATQYVFKKFSKLLIDEEQDALYKEHFMPYQMDIVQIELTGMPIDMEEVLKVEQELGDEVQAASTTIQGFQATKDAHEKIRCKKWEKDFEDRKAKAKNPEKIKPKDKDEFVIDKFNPGSGDQIRVLLYDVLNLPVLDKTDSGLPATGADVVEKLIHHTEDASVKEVLSALITYSKAKKIVSAFIPAFKNAVLKEDGHHYLHGSFNLGGTVSGRLSSSEPNLQNIPSNSKYAKLVKRCFKAAKGWIFCGADFESLEDYISALTTRDPNKLKVYIDGYDGHSLRAFSYWPEKFPWDELTPELSKVIKKDYGNIRSESKGVTFSLTYQGTWHTLVNDQGFSKEEAKTIEANYHDLYAVSDKWVQEQLQQAEKTGYVTVAFGLKVRTPLLHRTLSNKSTTPYEAAAEGRTAGNALGQSYGLLTNRALRAVMERIRNSRFRNAIRPVAMIHDAIYFLVRDHIQAVKFLNDVLIEEMAWQDLPELHHDKVKIKAELDLFHPDWSSPIGLKPRSSEEEILKTCRAP